MKTIIIFLSIIIGSSTAYSQQYSDITYGAGTSIEIQAGADVCATNIYIIGTFSGGGTICTGALPVTLSSFTSLVEKNNVRLNWTTLAELNNSGFDLERQKTASSWQKIGFVTGSGTTTEPKDYVYEDKKISTGTYKYRLKQIDYNGNFEYFALSSDVFVGAPNKFSVSQNYPNPSNPKSKIDYEIPFNGKVTLKIYDVIGKEVVTIINEVKDAGYYTAEFDGSNLASGVYFYRITAEGSAQSFTKTLKMVLVK